MNSTFILHTFSVPTWTVHSSYTPLQCQQVQSTFILYTFSVPTGTAVTNTGVRPKHLTVLSNICVPTGTALTNTGVRPKQLSVRQHLCALLQLCPTHLSVTLKLVSQEQFASKTFLIANFFVQKLSVSLLPPCNHLNSCNRHARNKPANINSHCQ